MTNVVYTKNIYAFEEQQMSDTPANSIYAAATKCRFSYVVKSKLSDKIVRLCVNLKAQHTDFNCPKISLCSIIVSSDSLTKNFIQFGFDLFYQFTSFILFTFKPSETPKPTSN